MQKFLNIYYSIICKTFFCMFNQIVILIKPTKINAVVHRCKNKWTKNCHTKFFCANIFDTKIVVAKINPQKFLWLYFCNIIFCINIFCITIVCVTNLCTFIFDSKETTHTEINVQNAKNVDAKFLVAKKTHAKINYQKYLTI